MFIFIFYFTGNFSYKICYQCFDFNFLSIRGFIFSFLKRKAKIKDTGKFFPGHGGVLDRLDGILLGLPLVL